MNLSGLFPHKTAAFYSDRCMTHCFESHKMLKPPLKNCDFIWDTIFTLDPSLASWHHDRHHFTDGFAH